MPGIVYDHLIPCLAFSSSMMTRYRIHIFGQWFQEVDSLDLEKGDYIVHIRVWYIQALAHYSNVLRASKHENIGQVLGIEISTFRGSVKRVLCGKTDCSLELDYFVNPLEELVSPSPSLSPK